MAWAPLHRHKETTMILAQLLIMFAIGLFIGFFLASLLAMSGRIARDEEINEWKAVSNDDDRTDTGHRRRHSDRDPWQRIVEEVARKQPR
jgi:hypothetical protein